MALKTLPVSVIISCYNTTQTLPWTLESVIGQTMKPAEVIVIDDGSTDNPGALVEDYRARLAPTELIVVRQANKGIAAARNTGVAMAKEPLLAFLDSDDCWLPEKLARQVLVFKDPEVVLCGTDFYVVNTLQPPRTRVSTMMCHAVQGRQANDVAGLYRGNYIGTSTAMVRAEALEDTGAFDTRLVVMEDYDLWQRLAQIGKVVVVPEPLLEYLDRPGSLTKKAARMWLAAVQLAWRHRPGMAGFVRQAGHASARSLVNAVKRGPLVGGQKTA